MTNIKIKNDKGEEKEYEVLFNYITKVNHLEYIVYTDFTRSEDNIIKCYSSILTPEGKIEKVEDEEQIQFIESTLASLADLSHLKYQITEY